MKRRDDEIRGGNKG